MLCRQTFFSFKEIGFSQGRRQGGWLGVAKCFDAAPPSQKDCAATPEKKRGGGGGWGFRHIFFL